jgi:hypothetical protein
MADKVPQPVMDAEFEVVKGPLRAGDHHPRHKGWRFLALYDRQGDPLFYNKLHDPGWWYRSIARWLAIALLAFVGLLGVLVLISGLFFGGFR